MHPGPSPKKLRGSWLLPGGNTRCLTLVWRSGVPALGAGTPSWGQGRSAAERLWAGRTPGLASGLTAVTWALPGAASAGAALGDKLLSRLRFSRVCAELAGGCGQQTAPRTPEDSRRPHEMCAGTPRGWGTSPTAAVWAELSEPRGHSAPASGAPPHPGPGLPQKGSSGGLRVAAGGESQAT